MSAIHRFRIIEKTILEEFDDFKAELLTCDSSEIFDRAQEILMKTLIVDEITDEFEAAIDMMADDELIIEALWTICTQPQVNLLNVLYDKWLEDISGLFDSEMVGEFFYNNYS